jgi:Flp pilus assembly CpaF family ATPase
VIFLIHANSAEQAVTRFLSCVLQSGVDLPFTAIRHSLAESLQLVVHIAQTVLVARGLRPASEKSAGCQLR